MKKSVDNKGRQLSEAGKVRKVVETDKRMHFVVEGETEEHTVIFNKIKGQWSCDCRYSTLQKKECSHIIAARLKA